MIVSIQSSIGFKIALFPYMITWYQNTHHGCPLDWKIYDQHFQFRVQYFMFSLYSVFLCLTCVSMTNSYAKLSISNTNNCFVISCIPPTRNYTFKHPSIFLTANLNQLIGCIYSFNYYLLHSLEFRAQLYMLSNSRVINRFQQEYMSPD